MPLMEPVEGTKWEIRAALLTMTQLAPVLVTNGTLLESARKQKGTLGEGSDVLAERAVDGGRRGGMWEADSSCVTAWQRK